MKLQEISNKPIVLVFGKLCSGKGTFCGNYYPNHIKIITSDVVRKVSGEQKRSGLHKTKHLDQEIAKELGDQIYELLADSKQVIVDGIRQHSILLELFERFGKNNIEMIWLEVPKNELKKRFLSRAALKDDEDFETAYQRDEELGLGDLETKLKADSSVKQINHF